MLTVSPVTDASRPIPVYKTVRTSLRDNNISRAQLKWHFADMQIASLPLRRRRPFSSLCKAQDVPVTQGMDELCRDQWYWRIIDHASQQDWHSASEFAARAWGVDIKL